MNNLRIYNGVNHDIKIYNENQVITNRNNQHFLKNINCKPDTIIGQSKPLSIVKNNQPTMINSANIYYPDGIVQKLDFQSDYYNYDIIVVSDIYAKGALQHCCIEPNSPMWSNYIDRLYTLEPVYESDRNHKKIGCLGFKKLCIFTPQFYFSLIQNKIYPSYNSIQLCINLFSSNAQYLPWINQLKEYLTMYSIY